MTKKDDDLQIAHNQMYWQSKSIDDALKLSTIGSLGMQGLFSNWQHSDTAKLIREIADRSNKLTFPKLLQDSLKPMGSMGMGDLFSNWQHSDTAKLIREIADRSNKLTFPKLLQDSPKPMDSLGMGDLFSNWQNSNTAKMIREIVKTQSEALSHISQVYNLSSLEKLASLDNSPFSGLSIPVSQGIDDPIEPSFVELDTLIEGEISSVTDFNKLSEQTKKILYILWVSTVYPIILSILACYIYDHYTGAKKELDSVSTPYEVKLFSRSSHKAFDPKMLKDFRITVANSLNFRSRPSMKSEIVDTLPIGKLVQVLDTSNNRSWLLVEVEINGKFEQGWVLRRYTTYFK